MLLKRSAQLVLETIKGGEALQLDELGQPLALRVLRYGKVDGEEQRVGVFAGYPKGRGYRLPGQLLEVGPADYRHDLVAGLQQVVPERGRYENRRLSQPKRDPVTVQPVQVFQESHVFLFGKLLVVGLAERRDHFY